MLLWMLLLTLGERVAQAGTGASLLASAGGTRVLPSLLPPGAQRQVAGGRKGAELGSQGNREAGLRPGARARVSPRRLTHSAAISREAWVLLSAKPRPQIQKINNYF